MIRDTPLWTLDRPKGTSAWPDRVRLWDDLVISQWYSAGRDSGSIIWERALPRVNFIVGILGNTILCSRIEPGWRSGKGACALRLTTGELLWSKRLSPLQIRQDGFLCMDGTVRDLMSGAVLQKEAPPERFFGSDLESSLHWAVTRTDWGAPPVELSPGVFVTCRSEPGRYCALGNYLGIDRNGTLLWSFSPGELGWECGHARTDRRICPPYIYLMASMIRPYEYVTDKQIRYVPCERHLIVLDVRVGRVVQELALGTWTGRCHIEDVDSQGALLSFAETRLAYFRREP